MVGWVGGVEGDLPAVPVTSHGLGVERNHHAKRLAHTLQDVPRHPPVFCFCIEWR